MNVGPPGVPPSITANVSQFYTPNASLISIIRDRERESVLYEIGEGIGINIGHSLSLI